MAEGELHHLASLQDLLDLDTANLQCLNYIKRSRLLFPMKEYEQRFS